MTDAIYRPPAEERWTDRMRTDPVRIELQTRWLYSQYDPKVLVPEGRTRHPFACGGRVVRSDVPSPYEHLQALTDHVHRAVEAFGDDKHLVIEVRLAESSSDSAGAPSEEKVAGRAAPLSPTEQLVQDFREQMGPM